MTALNLLFAIGDAWFASLVLTDTPILDSDTIKEILRSLTGALIWIPYMLVSKRVKKVFSIRAKA